MVEADSALAKVLEAPVEQKKWDFKWDCYVARRNGKEPAGDVANYSSMAVAPSGGPETTITRHKVEQLVELMHVANWWPQYALESFLPADMLPDVSTLEKGTDVYGKECLGMLRDASTDPEVVPRGVKPIKKEVSTGSTLSGIMDRSSEHIEEDQGRAVWAAEQDRLSMSVGTVQTKDGTRTVLLNKLVDADSDDDFANLGGTVFHSVLQECAGSRSWCGRPECSRHDCRKGKGNGEISEGEECRKVHISAGERETCWRGEEQSDDLER